MIEPVLDVVQPGVAPEPCQLAGPAAEPLHLGPSGHPCLAHRSPVRAHHRHPAGHVPDACGRPPRRVASRAPSRRPTRPGRRRSGRRAARATGRTRRRRTAAPRPGRRRMSAPGTFSRHCSTNGSDGSTPATWSAPTMSESTRVSAPGPAADVEDVLSVLDPRRLRELGPQRPAVPTHEVLVGVGLLEHLAVRGHRAC